MSTTTTKTELECYFDQFRKDIIGINQSFESPFGEQKIIYTDWTASGRLYRPIEEKLMNQFGPFVANTHTETTVSGTAMLQWLISCKALLKKPWANWIRAGVLSIAGKYSGSKSPLTKLTFRWENQRLKCKMSQSTCSASVHKFSHVESCTWRFEMSESTVEIVLTSDEILTSVCGCNRCMT